MPGDGQRHSAGSRAPAEREWLTLGQAAAYLGVAQSTVRKWADSKRLRAFYTPGGHRRFRRLDLEAFLAGGQAPRGDAQTSGRQRRVLVVDGDDRVRRLLREGLEGEGCAVREAASGEEGLAALEDEPADVVLLDVTTPRADASEMLRRVRERHGVEAIPVIMYGGTLEHAGDAAERGARAFVGKPFDPQRLVDATTQLLRS